VEKNNNNKDGYVGPVCYRGLNNNFQYLNNITRIFTHFFTYIFPKNTNNITKQVLDLSQVADELELP